MQIAMDRLATTAPNRMMLLRWLNTEIATTYGGIPSDVRKQIDRLMAAVKPVADTKGAVKNYHELDSLLNLQRKQVKINPDAVAANRLRAVCTDAEMVDMFKASITTEVSNISENEKRLLNHFLNWVENPENAERTWSEVKAEVIRIAQRGDAKSEQARSQQQGMQGQQQQGAHSVAAARMQNNTDAGQQGDDRLQLAMTAVEDAGGEIAFKHSAGSFKAPTGGIQHPWSRGHGAGEGSGGQRSAEGRPPPSVCWYWKKAGKCQRGDGCLWAHTHTASNYQPKEAGPAAKKLRGDDGEEY